MCTVSSHREEPGLLRYGTETVTYQRLLNCGVNVFPKYSISAKISSEHYFAATDMRCITLFGSRRLH
jgi:hypothetical protein